MAENVFEAVKLSVSTREAAEFYGIKVRRNGMACCPFHDDKNPSMKVDQRFHCFGCGEDGDVIDFTAKLFDLSPKEAAEKLAQDFGLIYDSQAPPRRRYVRQKNEAQKFREDRQHCYRVLSDYYYLLKKWEADRSPRTPEEEPHPRFVEAIQKKPYVEYLLDLFLYESEEEQKAWIAEHTAEITHLERRLKIMAENKPTNRERLREITDGIEQGIKELFESEKYMRYLSVMSRFHRYSVNNTMLIYMQKPDATLVAGYNKWKDQFERHVKKGEHGITIIAPTPYKKKIEEQKLDPDTKAPILDKDGKVVTEEKEIDQSVISDYKEISGYGISVMAGEKKVFAGNTKLMDTECIEYTTCEKAGTKVYLAVDGQYAGCILITDEVKPDSKKAISDLKHIGVEKTVMLTGDDEKIGKSVAEELQLDEYYAQLLPDQKVEKVELLDGKKRPGSKLAFVGDGINDAPVLARADVGIAMGGLGSDAAIEAADVVLMTDEPSKLVDAIEVAKATKQIVMQNIVIALGIKSVFLILGALGIAGMWEAVFGDVGVTIIAVLNAMRILKK